MAEHAMRLLYPSEPFNKNRPDEQFVEEYEAATAAGLQPLIFSFEDFESGALRASLPFTPGDLVLYRGWMLTPKTYADWVNHLHDRGATAVTSPAQYRLCHHLPQWYPLLVGKTSETLVLAADTDFKQALAGLHWSGYFIKDYVKSLNTGRGSLVDRPEDIEPLLALMLQYRGSIEGGVCVRQRENYLQGTERRYFVFHGQAYGADGEVPELVSECAQSIDSPFFSIDVARREDGVLRVVELGDGQVSDRKEWPAQTFVRMFNQ